MQQLLLDFLFLGHVPGTSIDLSFWQILLLLFLSAASSWLHRYRYGWTVRALTRMRYTRQAVVLEFRLLLLRLRLTQ